MQVCLTWATLFLASGATATFLISGLPQQYGWVKPTLTFLTAALSLLSLVMQNQKKYTECADLHFRWNRLAGEYSALWNETYAESASAALARLNEKAADLSKSGMWVGYKERILLKWENQVLQQHGVATA